MGVGGAGSRVCRLASQGQQGFGSLVCRLVTSRMCGPQRHGPGGRATESSSSAKAGEVALRRQRTVEHAQRRCVGLGGKELEDGQHAAGGDVVAVEEAQRVGCGEGRGHRRVAYQASTPALARNSCSAYLWRAASWREMGARGAGADRAWQGHSQGGRRRCCSRLSPMGSHIRSMEAWLPPWLLNQSVNDTLSRARTSRMPPSGSTRELCGQAGQWGVGWGEGRPQRLKQPGCERGWRG